MVVEFVWLRWVNWGAPWESSGTLGVAGFIELRSDCRRVRSGSLGSLGCALRFLLRWGLLCSLGCALGVVEFVRGRWVHWGATWARRVRSGSLCSLGYALGVIGFVRCRWIHCGAPFDVVWFVQGHWIHWSTPWESFGVARFIGARPVGRRVCSGSLSTLVSALGVVGFIRGNWVHWGAPLWSSRSFGVAGLIAVHPGSRVVR